MNSFSVLAPPQKSHAERPQSRGEELANALSHGLGLLLAVAALPVLLHAVAQQGRALGPVGVGGPVGPVGPVSVSAFCVSMMLLYGASTLYHALPAGRAKRFFNRLDHAAIYVFIAGSYMPYLLGALRGPWGWSLFGVVWGAAALGVGAKLCNRLRRPLWSTGLYVAMGWVAVVAAVPLVERLAWPVLAWLLAGGVAYTAGAVVFHFDARLRYGHFVWHLFVLAGTACHLVAVWLQIG